MSRHIRPQTAWERESELVRDVTALLAQPEKDTGEVDRLVDELERVQLDITAELGMKGNNPSE